MTEKTLKKANEIKAEMDKLKRENAAIKEVVCWFPDTGNELCNKRNLHCIKTKRIRKKLKSDKSFVISDWRYNFLLTLTNDDIDALFNLRLVKYHELQKELENLNDEVK